ncbi:MAG: ATP-binding protein [Pirellulales bacterium]|nr:ATP-binding protein [Pirellulales bacterium]
MIPAGIPSEAEQQSRVDQAVEMAALAGGLAHEIKNPLSTIRMNMELLAEDFADAVSPRDRRALNKIRLVEREALRLQNILDDFLNFTKARRMDLLPADLNAEIEQLLEVYAPQAAEAKVDLLTYLDPELPGVRLDTQAFQAVLWNLILNAQQAMPDGGQLVVRTSSVGPAVLLEFIDTGCGMEEATITKIFEPFYSTKPGGSGLGLPMTKKIVEAHGGAIDIQSEPGRGSKFTIILPVLPRLGGDEPAAQAPAAA